MQTTPFPPAEFNYTDTFQNRGAAVPFTTPRLAGTRVRHSRRPEIELITPNPSGGRGIYVVPWAGVRELCNPTLHDRTLIHRLADLPTIDPASVRDAAMEVAMEGYAGRNAAAAARASRDQDNAHRALAHFRLLAGLIEQVEPTGRKPTMLGQRSEAFDQLAGAALRRLAPSLGYSADYLTDGLATMGDLFAPVGVDRDDQTARIPRLIARLGDAYASVVAWLAAHPESDISGLGETVTASMKVANDGSQALLACLRAMLADPLALLKRWIGDPDDAEASASHCDWLLDGWECVCLLWTTATSTTSRRAALLEMGQILPVLPREVAAWLAIPIPPAAIDSSCRVTSRHDAWRSGAAAFALIQRNEALRAMSL
ncbi:MAG TPA: hypothetical protein VGF36_09300 [Rhodopila sp.]